MRTVGSAGRLDRLVEHALARLSGDLVAAISAAWVAQHRGVSGTPAGGSRSSGPGCGSRSSDRPPGLDRHTTDGDLAGGRDDEGLHADGT